MFSTNPNPKPDRPALERLAEHIRSLPDRFDENNRDLYCHGAKHSQPLFDWSLWYESARDPSSCGTFGCVAGHAVALFPHLLQIGNPDCNDRDFGIFSPLDEDINGTSALMVLGLTYAESACITLGSRLAETVEGTYQVRVRELDEVLSSHRAAEAADRILTVLRWAELRHERLKAILTPPDPLDLPPRIG